MSVLQRELKDQKNYKEVRIMMNVSSAQEALSNYVSSTGQASNTKKTDEITTRKANYGKTVGEPKLSDKAAAYYEELKKKYSKMDFVLVSRDKKDQARLMASGFANPHKTVVLIDEEKIEKMAEDESFRQKYEGLIEQASSGLSQLKKQMDSMGADVKGYGMTVNDGGTATFFAVLRKSSDAQKERIEQKREEKRAEKKAEEKKAQKEKEKERIESKKTDIFDEVENDDDVEIIYASSVEELTKKVGDYFQNSRMNSIMTDQEMMVGQHIDFKG